MCDALSASSIKIMKKLIHLIYEGLFITKLQSDLQKDKIKNCNKRNIKT